MAISFNQLGNYGHLGNQMFQYASLRGIAKNNNLDFVIPPKEHFGSSYSIRTSIYDCFELSFIKDNNIGIPSNTRTFHETSYQFDNALFNNCADGIDLFGYYQSPKYFNNIEKEIRTDFKFKKSVIKEANDFISTKEIIDFASLHIRRTDYVTLSHALYNLPESYYIEAISMLPKGMKIIVFSDDIEWCKQQEFLIKNNVIFSNFNSYSDLYLMTMAKFNIIANSTFSWWGAWLNQTYGKITICPKMWFGPSLPDHTTEDLILDDWIKI